MIKGIKTRYIAHKILSSIKNKSKNNFDEILNFYILKYNLSSRDTRMVYSIVLTSMRNNENFKNIIKNYAKKKLNLDNYLLLLSATTQILYLDYKEYAVVNCTVELAKYKNINGNKSFINAILKKIIKEKDKLKYNKINIKSLPNWFINKVKNLNIAQKKLIVKSITEQPNLHLVFKNSSFIKKFDYNNKKTSNNSLIVEDNPGINKLPRFSKGEWWVQDYSSMLPIYLTKNIKGKEILDMCSAPGGKAFQVLSLGGNVDMIEKNSKRAEILKENLKRLNYHHDIRITDALNLDETKKYDFILIDAPCSSVGTIRKNPEIFFRKNSPKFDQVIELQYSLLNKAKKIIKSKGIIIYMVCSFLQIETIKQINNFLKKNPKFTIEKFKITENKQKLIDENGFINIIPRSISNFKIDGFFAAKLKKHD